MILLENQVALKFSVGPFLDFIDITDFMGMEIKENAGGIRPILAIRFNVNDDKVLPYLNEGNLITLSYGIKQPTSDILQFKIEGQVVTQQYGGGAYVELLGSMYNPLFTDRQSSNQFIGKKSFEVFQQIANETALKFRTNVTKTDDQQDWYQNGLTGWEFINFVFPNVYLDNSTFFAYGFDNNNLYLYDMKQYLKQGPKWILTVTGKGSTDNSTAPVINIATYQATDTYSGQMNKLIGKNKTTHGYNVDTGEFFEAQAKLQSYCTMDTTKLNINSTNCEEHSYKIMTGSQHANALNAQIQNMNNNLLYSSYVVYVPVIGQYRDFRLLDTVLLVPAETDKQAQGLYIITSICRQLKDNKLQVNLTLSRESANGLVGDSLQKGV